MAKTTTSGSHKLALSSKRIIQEKDVADFTKMFKRQLLLKDDNDAVHKLDIELAGKFFKFVKDELDALQKRLKRLSWLEQQKKSSFWLARAFFKAIEPTRSIDAQKRLQQYLSGLDSATQINEFKSLLTEFHSKRGSKDWYKIDIVSKGNERWLLGDFFRFLPKNSRFRLNTVFVTHLRSMVQQVLDAEKKAILRSSDEDTSDMYSNDGVLNQQGEEGSNSKAPSCG